MKYIVFHHDDLDGRCSAAIIKKYLLLTHGSEIEINIYTFEVSYNGKQEDIMYDASIDENSTVYVVDFCFDIKIMESLLDSLGDNFIWIDHHITSMQRMKHISDSIKGLRDSKYSATLLCWFFCFGKNGFIPLIIKYIDTFDCWKQDNEFDWENVIIPFKYGMETEITDLNDIDNVWDELIPAIDENCAEDRLNNIVLRGLIIKQYIEQQDEKYAEQNAYVIMFENKRTLIINKVGNAAIALRDTLYNPDEHDIMMSYFIDGENKINVRAYSDKSDIPVNNIAKKYGGGGHKGAAGFQLPIDQIHLLLKS